MAVKGEYRGMLIDIPDWDHEYREYFEYCKQHKLMLKKCKNCGLMRWEPGPGCPWCASLDYDWQEVSGKGAIHSYEVVTQAIQPGFADVVPYPVILVELDNQSGVPTPGEGIRIVTNLVDANVNFEKPENVKIGARVELVWQDIGPDLVLPQFKLSNEQPRGKVFQAPNTA